LKNGQKYDKRLITEEKVEIIIQVDGKLRDKVEVDIDFYRRNS
jgi:hypothetical protein